jgi:diketogulonate reductase-like aldo/keto reductase
MNIPKIGFGTWELSQKDAEEGVFFALKEGYRLIDTAAIYKNEEGVGKGIRRAMQELGLARKEIFVTTKLWNADHNNPKKALMTSLEKLGLDYVDLYLIHWPVKESLATWKKFEEFKKEGLVKNIGVSNFTMTHLEQLFKISKEIPYANQVELSPFLYQKELIKFCSKHKIKIMSYSPIMRGKMLDNKVVDEIAEKKNKTPAQVVLRWHVQLGLIPIPKSKHKERIKENLGVFDFKLSAKEMNSLSALSNGTRFCWNPNDKKWAFLAEAAKLVKC